MAHLRAAGEGFQHSPDCPRKAQDACEPSNSTPRLSDSIPAGGGALQAQGCLEPSRAGLPLWGCPWVGVSTVASSPPQDAIAGGRLGPGSLTFMGGGAKLLIGIWGGVRLTWAVLGLVLHREGHSYQPSASLLLPRPVAGTASAQTDTAVDPLPGEPQGVKAGLVVPSGKVALARQTPGPTP